MGYKFINKKKILALVICFTGILSIYVYAAPADTTPIDNIVNWLATWAGKIGLVVAFFGGLQVSLAFKNDDADAKVRGLKTLASGFMVFGITQALDLFGL